MLQFNPTKTFINEIKFFNGLNKTAIKLLISNLLFEVTSPLIYIFSNSFFWYKTQDLKLILLFNLYFYLFIPVSFFLNAFLLKKINVKYLAFFGLILQGFSLLFYIFNLEPTGINTFIFGSTLGLFSGFYWANRNFMEFQTTNDENRDYYYGLYLSGATLIAIIFNSLYGNFLAHEDVWGLSKESLYIITSFFGAGIVIISGYYLLIGKYRNPIVRNIFLSNPNENWIRARKIYFLTGLREANSFLIPTLLVLYVLKREDFLGEANSLASIVVSITIYIIGRLITKKARKTIITTGVMILVINSLLILFFNSEYFAFIYNSIEATGNILIYLSLIPLLLKQIDVQKDHNDLEYKFLFDADLFLNFGRISGTIFILIIFTIIGDEWGIRLTPILFVLPNLLFLRNIYLVKE